MDWSVIWHNFDVVDDSKGRREEREREIERIKTPPVSSPKNLQKVLARKVWKKKLHLPDTVGPKTRRRSCPPRKEKSLRNATESRSWSH